MKQNKPRILLWDIESSFNILYTFSLWGNDYINPENIITERHLFCISYKWYGEKKIHTISILDDAKRFNKDIHDDYYVVSKFRDVIDSADAIVGHNQDNFDIRMLNGRLLFHNLKPLPKIKSFDTKKLASKYFRLNSNKLDYVSQYLGHKGKMENPKDLWHKCMVGDKKALKHMAKYNRQDIDALEHVFEKIMPFVKNYQLNMGMFLKGARCVNPTCGSTDIEWRGYNYTRVNKYRRAQCRSCGCWMDERKCVPAYKPKLK